MLLYKLNILLLITAFFLCGCSDKKKVENPLFVVLGSNETGIDFTNSLQHTPEFNLFKYMYFYNGSGVGAGDFNNDGKIDLFFGSNQGQNKIYLNQGSLKFKDITYGAGIPNDGGWTTGVSVVDINNDGLLDVYVCRVGHYETLSSKNQLLINQGLRNGIPYFVDKAPEYGLDFSGFSTQAAFFDYDNDDDLDMYLLNHSVHHNNNFQPRKNFEGTYDSLSGDRILRNDGNRFTDVTRQAGIKSTSIGYGLGIAIADINLDGYPDIYIGNDFHENDYLYINQKNGTFIDEGEKCMMHTSQYSMGVDVADLNNDGHPEIVSMDMLPSDPYILKRSLGEDTYDLFHEKIRMGYSHQFTRNNLQFNRRNGMFSEVGLYSGVAATDWSWAPLFIDFDNDGLKDLFISNGIPKRMNDIDYVNFVTSGDIQRKINSNDVQKKDMALIEKFPEIKIPNKFYRNRGNLSFADEESLVEGDAPTFSNGAVYADLDNDGDLDIVVSNIDDPALIYENKSGDTQKSFIQLKLKGPQHNRNATGTRVFVFSGQEIRSYDNQQVKGFLSSMEIPLHIGTGKTNIDSIIVVWPDRTYQRLDLSQEASIKEVSYQQGLPAFDFSVIVKWHQNETTEAVDITGASGIDFVHAENRFAEFDREPLLPHMVSTEGPAIAVADINGDGLEDVFLGGSRDQKSALFLQQSTGKFVKSAQPFLDADSVYENTSATFADINRDGFPDLIVASGGNEFYGDDYHNTPRIYLNDGNGNLSRLSNPFGDVYLTASVVVANDFNNDGYTDLFIGARAFPWAYGQVPQSYLFQNNKNGTFTNVTNELANGLTSLGFITNAIWNDIDSDRDDDLLLTLQWGGVVAFLNDRGSFSKKELTDKKGWWNFVLPVDVNGDGKMDLIAGNLGLNSRLKATEKEPVRLYYNDFDANGKKEQVLTYHVSGKELPFATKAELEKQMPVLKKKFLYAEDLAKASLNDLFGKQKLSSSEILAANYFANAVLLNKGNMVFETVPLPWQAQLTSFRDAVVVNANNDNKPDVLLVGNYYDNNIEMGRYDADFGTLLINEGSGNFSCSSLNGLTIKGQVRKIRPVMVAGKQAYVLARNNDSAMLIRFTR